MALTNCPECGRTNVSESAERCPECGFGIKAYFEKIKFEEEHTRKKEEERIKKLEIQQRNYEKLENEKREEIKRVQEEGLPPKPLFFEQFGAGSILSIMGLFLFGCYGIIQIVNENAEEGASFYVALIFIIIFCIIWYKFKQYLKKMSKYKNIVNNFDAYKQNKILEINEKYYKLANVETVTIPLPKVQERDENIVKCPRCGSTNIQVVKRGWKVTTGFIGSGKNERVCVNCMKKF